MKIKKLLNIGSAFVISLSALLTLGIPKIYAVGDFSCTWTGAGTPDGQERLLMSDPDNWDNATCNGDAPQSGDSNDLVFPQSATNKNVYNDIDASESFNSITFSGTGDATGYTIDGNDIEIMAGISDTTTAPTPEAAALNLISANITFTGDQTISVTTQKETLLLYGDFSGNGNLTKTGNGAVMTSGDNSVWSGGITVNGGALIVASAKSLGTSADIGATINNGTDFLVVGCFDMTFEGNVTLTGNSYISELVPPSPKFASAVGCDSLGSSYYEESFGSGEEHASNLTMSGTITLGSDITFGAITGTTTISGPLVGAHEITMLPGYTGKLVITNSSATTPNGTYTSALFTKTISDSSAAPVEIFGNNVITIDGTRGDVGVFKGGILKGTGTVGSLLVGTGGIVAPGHSPGCITSSGLTLNGIFQAELGGTTACSGYDQAVVNGAVDVTGGTLTPTLYNGFVPAVGQSYTIINNDGSDAVTGTFAGVAQGGTVTNTGVTYSVSYVGGDGNDVVITVTAIDASLLPKSPNTGFGMLAANPLLVLAATLLTGSALVVMSRRMKTTNK